MNGGSALICPLFVKHDYYDLFSNIFRDVPQKSDDFFSFPMNLDMAPYTVECLASRDEPSEGNTNGSDSRPISPAAESNSVRQVTRYVLRGVVVHSGRASGGHYFSYIRSRDQKTGKYLWHLFNDSKVRDFEFDLSLNAQLTKLFFPFLRYLKWI